VILEMMGELKLSGMRVAYDEIVTSRNARPNGRGQLREPIQMDQLNLTQLSEG
jgi:hypothetical protein